MFQRIFFCCLPEQYKTLITLLVDVYNVYTAIFIHYTVINGMAKFIMCTTDDGYGSMCRDGRKFWSNFDRNWMSNIVTTGLNEAIKITVLLCQSSTAHSRLLCMAFVASAGANIWSKFKLKISCTVHTSDSCW